jgi:hypothetical protein
VQTQPDWICISKSDSSLTCGITAVSSDCFWFERKWNAWAPNGPSAIWGKNRHSLMVEVFIFLWGLPLPSEMKSSCTRSIRLRFANCGRPHTSTRSTLLKHSATAASADTEIK